MSYAPFVVVFGVFSAHGSPKAHPARAAQYGQCLEAEAGSAGGSQAGDRLLATGQLA
jgi:hypothetical protein